MASTKRRYLLAILYCLAAAGVTALWYREHRGRIESESEVVELQDALDDAKESLEAVEEAQRRLESDVDGLSGAVFDLTRQVRDFDYENWRDVVPGVQSASSDIESKFGEVQSSADQLKSSLSDAVDSTGLPARPWP